MPEPEYSKNLISIYRNAGPDGKPEGLSVRYRTLHKLIGRPGGFVLTGCGQTRSVLRQGRLAVFSALMLFARMLFCGAVLISSTAAAGTLKPAIPHLIQSHIRNQANGKCLGAAGSPQSPDIVLFPCNDHPDQLWTMSNSGQLMNQNNQCIGVAGGNVSLGTKLIGFRCDGTSNQRWTYNPQADTGYGIFANGANSKFCMTPIITADKLNRVALNDCTGEPAQEWCLGNCGGITVPPQPTNRPAQQTAAPRQRRR